MRVGEWLVETLDTGAFALDGGAMFGVVPRTNWSRLYQPDSDGRVQLAARCLLARHDGGLVVVIDTGMGVRWMGRARDTYLVEEGRGIIAALAARGVSPEEVTDVVATHLHFDHAGGLVETGPERKLRPAFPKAKVHLQAEQLAWARDPSPKDRASFRAADYAPLEQAGLLEVHEGPGELLPGLEVRLSHGHTPAMMVPMIRSDEAGVVFATDLIPTLAHLQPAWVMAYDNRPVLIVEEKAALLDEICERGWTVVMDHEPAAPAFTLTRDKNRLVPTTVDL
jgi:glyoxylase-like metal-dependent hydrolase (beta-lactamase superfamily II)